MYYRPPANNNFQHDQRNLLDRKSVVAAVHGNALGGIVQLQNHKKRQQGQRHRHDHAGAYAVGIARQGAVPVCQAAEQTGMLTVAEMPSNWLRIVSSKIVQPSFTRPSVCQSRWRPQ